MRNKHVSLPPPRRKINANLSEGKSEQIESNTSLNKSEQNTSCNSLDMRGRPTKLKTSKSKDSKVIVPPGSPNLIKSLSCVSGILSGKITTAQRPIMRSFRHLEVI
jgi:hypothetical protein